MRPGPSMADKVTERDKPTRSHSLSSQRPRRWAAGGMMERQLCPQAQSGTWGSWSRCTQHVLATLTITHERRNLTNNRHPGQHTTCKRQHS